jgi:hypothetical protein
MPFFAPNHAIVEAYEYDGTPQCAKEIIKWAEPQITTSDQIKFIDSRLIVTHYPGSVNMQKIRNVNKGDHITIRTGSIAILCREDIKENYALIPLLDW